MLGCLISTIFGIINGMETSNVVYKLGKELLINKFPEIAKSFHPTLNGDLDVTKLATKSGRKVWWQCDKDQTHVWQAIIAARTSKLTGCSFCSGRFATKENNLCVTHPEIAKEWHPTKNGELTPSKVKFASHNNVWWLCSNGHEWQVMISSRTSSSKGFTGCPYCASKLPTESNNLAVLFPVLINEWYTTKNGNLKPEQFLPYSEKKVWWICQFGHEWEMQIDWRTKQKFKCPYCSGKRVSNTNNLAVRFPELIKEWDYSLNNVSPNEVTCGTHRKVWWKCQYGHSWQAVIYTRIKGVGCPYCTGKLASPERNLLALFPDLAKEYHPTKNDCTPDQLPFGSDKRVWWICKEGHEWETSVNGRTSKLTGCPLCCWVHTSIEKVIEEKLGLTKFNKKALINCGYQPDFKLTDDLYMNVDGLYWHSDLYKENNYHFKMREAYESLNKQILQFYEDEVREKLPIICSMVGAKTGKTGININARQCVVTTVDFSIAKEFCDTNHLMGSVLAKYFGLYSNNELVSIIGLKRQLGSSLEIARFCNKLGVNVRGGFQKLLAYTIDVYKPNKVISFCDLRYSTGIVYKKAGFDLISISQGWYWVDTAKIKRYNRLACTAGNGKTEAENAKELGWNKIYDAGQAKYILTIS